MFKYTVVIPCHNSESTIEKAILSCLNQTYKNFEIIIINDSSNDKTEEILNKIKNKIKNHNINFKIFSLNSNCGPANARNVGWENANGDYIAFLDSDDAWHPQKLEAVDYILQKNRQIDLLGHAHIVGGNKFKLQDENKEITLKQKTFLSLLIRNFAVTPSIVLKKDIPDKFNIKMRFAEDHELWLRIANKYNVYYTPMVLTSIGRQVLARGGLSGYRLKMRFGEIKMYYAACRYKTGLIFLLPMLIVFSVMKHFYGLFKKIKQTNA